MIRLVESADGHLLLDRDGVAYDLPPVMSEEDLTDLAGALLFKAFGRPGCAFLLSALEVGVEGVPEDLTADAPDLGDVMLRWSGMLRGRGDGDNGERGPG